MNGSTYVTNKSSANAADQIDNLNKFQQYATRITKMSPEEANHSIQNNPQKASQMTAALSHVGVGNAEAKVKKQPKKAARTIVGLIGTANGNAIKGGDDGGNCGVTNPGGCIPGPGDLLDGFMKYIGNGIADHLKPIIQGFSNVLVGLPAPGEGWDVSTWPNPHNGWWPGIYTAYTAFMAISVPLLGIIGLHAYDTGDPYERRKRLRRLALHAGMILFGAVFVIPASLHFFDTVAQSLAPHATEFFSTPGDVGKFSVGLLLGTVILFLQSSIILIGIGVLLAIFVLIHMLVAFWPLFWLSRLAPISAIKWVGNAGIAAFYSLCMLRVIQSGFLRVLFSLPWDPVTAGAVSAVAAAFMTIIGLYAAFITFPKYFGKKAIPSVQMFMNESPSKDQIRDRYQASRQRIGDVKGRYESIRGTSETENTTPRAQTGRHESGTFQTVSEGSTESSGSGMSASTGPGSSSNDTDERQGVDTNEWQKRQRRIKRRSNKGYQ